jgi:hypothetical protein
MLTQLLLTHLTKTTYNLDAQERKKARIIKCRYVAYITLFWITSFKIVVILAKDSHFFSISLTWVKWAMFLSSCGKQNFMNMTYDNTIESKEKLWKEEIGNGYGTIGKQHAGKSMGSNINSMTTLIFLFSIPHITILVWHQQSSCSYIIFFFSQGRPIEWPPSANAGDRTRVWGLALAQGATQTHQPYCSYIIY